jgi:predicted transcriptional regulator
MKQPNVKAEMIKMLEALPDELTWGDLQYHIYVRRKIERGMQAVEAGRTFSQEEVEKHFEGLMKKWR